VSSTGEITTLHVDDDREFVELASTHVERTDESITVVTETCADDGLDRLDDDIDCVVSDYQMPGTNGLEFLEAVRGEYPEFPFVLFTGKGSEEIASEAIFAGVTDYLQKTGGTEQYQVLANRVRNAVEQYRAKHALAESERRLQTLVDNLPGLVYRAGIDDPWPMEFVGGRAEEVTGYSSERFERGEVTFGDDLIVEEDEQRVEERVLGAVERNEAFEVTYYIETPDGVTKRVWERGTPLFEDGEPVALEGLVMAPNSREWEATD
jgi:CheY-like chemotaxis protein